MKLAALAALTILSSLPGRAAAQTGPWTDGELLVQSQLPAGASAISRVIPETGASAVLSTVQYWGGPPGSSAFDSFRGGFLANVSMPPDNPFSYRLWLFLHDGTATAMPGFSGSLRALASAGDGRVFFIRHASPSQGPQTIEYFDAANVLRTLKQGDGVTPFGIEVDRLLYHAPSNALIGASSHFWSATNCSASGSASLYRIPLSADGLRVDGAVSCTSVDAPFLVGGDPAGLDTMPDGHILVTTASTNFPAVNAMLSLDPVTLAFTAWAEPDQGIVKGGVWSARLGKAVIQVAGPVNTSELRTFTGGQSGPGSLLATAPLGVANGLLEVDTNGPACEGLQIPYGAGLQGNSGFVPLLGAVGCPDIGEVFTLSINAVVGGAHGILLVGLAPGASPFKGGTLLLGSLVAQFPIALGGAPGVAGAGFLALPAILPSPALVGVNLYLQAGFADVAAVHDISLTNGLRLQGN